MSARSDQIQQLLATLHKHSDLVAEAFDGAISGGDRKRDDAIEALFGVGALKPYDEDSYRINPRLREFFSDHLASYHAFEALRVVTSTINQGKAQWDELRQLLRTEGTAKDQARLVAALDESIAELAYSVEHNLSMLHALLSTQYGNVENLATKLRQNRYYEKQVKDFSRDVQAIGAFAERMAEEAVAVGSWEVRRLAVRRLSARILSWTSQIKDAQAVISERLFKAAKMEERLRRLSRYALWLNRHRTAAGWEVDVTETSSAAVFPPQTLDFRPQPDVQDSDPLIVQALISAAARLPAIERKVRSVEDDEPQLLIDADDDMVEEVIDPVRQAVMDLIAQTPQSPTPVSLLQWKSGRSDLDEIGDESWLLFACMQLRGSGLEMRFPGHIRHDPFEINEAFFDVEVFAIGASGAISTSRPNSARQGS